MGIISSIIVVAVGAAAASSRLSPMRGDKIYMGNLNARAGFVLDSISRETHREKADEKKRPAWTLIVCSRLLAAPPSRRRRPRPTRGRASSLSNELFAFAGSRPASRRLAVKQFNLRPHRRGTRRHVADTARGVGG
jgi:hypothetical protein